MSRDLGRLADELPAGAVAIIGRAGRFPGAPSVDALWAAVASGRDIARRFSDRELLDAGVNPRTLTDPDYVNAGVTLDDVDRFDAGFFGYSPREAEITDPQQRLLLECANAALEDAGHVPARFDGDIGVYAGTTTSSYLLRNLLAHDELVDALGVHQLMISNDKAFASTRLSYKLGLTGPSVSVDTACSTSLVAVHQACQALLGFEVDMAIAGGASVVVPQGAGYRHDEGGILSADGHCRAFDARATGTLLGSGVGLVVLRRLEDALTDGDQVIAVIRGSAINNDGSSKVGFTAPSVEGQSRVIVAALEVAGVNASSICYVEAHGTGTPLGDVVEVRALTEAYRTHTDRTQFCALGSVKATLGHLDAAAGVCGLIKAAEAVRRAKIPPAVNVDDPNPAIDFPSTPFFLTSELLDWDDTGPRRAAVSSFGLGGTNAHLVLEEAPRHPRTQRAARTRILPVSALNDEALDRSVSALADHLAVTEADLDDIAFTLQSGRAEMPCRLAVVAEGVADAAERLTRPRTSSPRCGAAGNPPAVVFAFPGNGVLRQGMTRGLYLAFPAFRDALDECARVAEPHLGFDLTTVLFGEDTAASGGAFDSVVFLHTAMVGTSYAMARLVESWGVTPDRLLGYSLGEFTAACLAGVYTLEDAIGAVCTRARLIQHLPPGRMLAVPLAEADLVQLLGGCALAGINTPDMCVVAGTDADIAALVGRLARIGIDGRSLDITRAYHSPAMDPVIAPLGEYLATLSLDAARLPIASTVTGTWLTAGEATDPLHWAAHARRPVRFADALRTATTDGPTVVVEVGPGVSLTALVHQTLEDVPAVPLGTRVMSDDGEEERAALAAAASLWTTGVPLDWSQVDGGHGGRTSLPTYPFARERHWIDPPARRDPTPSGTDATSAVPKSGNRSRRPIDRWLYRPTWNRTPAPREQEPPERCLLVHDGGLLGAALVARLAAQGSTVVETIATTASAQRPDPPSAYDELLQALGEGGVPTQIIHAVDDGEGASTAAFASLIHLAQGLGRALVTDDITLVVVTTNGRRTPVDERSAAGPGLIAGATRVISQEYPNVRAVTVDVDAEDLDRRLEVVAQGVLTELFAHAPDRVVALRGTNRLVQSFAPVDVEPTSPDVSIRAGGAYLITGAFGGVGQTLAHHLAVTAGANLVLVHRPGELTQDRRAFVTELTDLGIEVLLAPADVTDQEALASAIAGATERFGRIDGVFHLAALPGGGVVQRRDLAAAEHDMAPKVAGATILDGLLADADLDFLALFSSVTGTLGGVAHADYSAANAYLDALALARQGRHHRVVSLAWSRWEGVGMAAAASGTSTLPGWGVDAADALTAREAMTVLDQALTLDDPHLVISPTDLTSRFAEAERLEAVAADEFGGADDGSQQASTLDPTELKARLCAIWRSVLGVESTGDESFFDLGGDSLLLVQVHRQIKDLVGRKVPVVALFRFPTIDGLVTYLGEDHTEEVAGSGSAPPRALSGDIAVVAMAGRFPGARDVAELWHNITHGVESIVLGDDIRSAETDGRHFVPAVARPDDVEMWDAAFFGSSPREAVITDPQQRLIMECAYEALEKAGWTPERSGPRVGVFAGTATSTYLFHNLLPNLGSGSLAETDALQLAIGNDKDYLATRISYSLGLTGPSVNVNTACSTSLVAVHMACDSLLRGECDLVLAGGVRIDVSATGGYTYQVGAIQSPDGRCRTFDAGANGTVLGSGAAVVALRRLENAVADGDHIHAVIKGSAINNDGSDKIGFAAPSPRGQTEVILEAQRRAAVDPATIGLVEAHGTGTALGDPIEVAALTEAFRQRTDAVGTCAIGSIKPNVGHLDAAAGVTGLIKAVLAIEHGLVPPTLNVTNPNPHIDFASSPFYLPDRLGDWPLEGPRRACVSSFGIGGTNAHVVLEEAPRTAAPPATSDHGWQVLPLSARSPAGCEQAAALQADHLQSHPELPLARVARTLQDRGRFSHRLAVIARTTADAAADLADGTGSFIAGPALSPAPPLVYLLPGQGAERSPMFAGLYRDHPQFAEVIDRCSRTLLGEVAWDLRAVLLGEAPTDVDVHDTNVTQPVMLAVELALCELLQMWGVAPTMVVGHSVGELAAATIAGVFEPDDAVRLAAERGRLMAAAPEGRMLAVRLDEDRLREILPDSCAVAAVNGPSSCVASGPAAAIDALRTTLAEWRVHNRRLPSRRAFHSSLMDAAADAFRDRVAAVRSSPSTLPLGSNVTGTIVPPDTEFTADYWARQLREPVRFADALLSVADRNDVAVVEVGPGTHLSTAARRCLPALGRRLVTTSPSGKDDERELLTAAAKLWTLGVDVDWRAASRTSTRRVCLPATPFERQRYWVDPPAPAALPVPTADAAPAPRDQWLQVPTWESVALPPSAPPRRGAAAWLVLWDGETDSTTGRLAEQLRKRGDQVRLATPADVFGDRPGDRNGQHTAQATAIDRLVGAVARDFGRVERLGVIHGWSVGGVTAEHARGPAVEELGFRTLVHFAGAFDAHVPGTPVDLCVLTTRAHRLPGDEPPMPDQALSLGPCLVLPLEDRRYRAAAVDVDLRDDPADVAQAVLAELDAGLAERVVAVRAGNRFVRRVRLHDTCPAAWGRRPLRHRGVYLVTGGLGGVGMALAHHLAVAVQARLVLVGRSADAATAADDERIRTIEAAGGEVLVLAADVTDRGAVAAVLEAAEARFGPVNGVIHAAGVAGGGLTALRTDDAIDAVLAPKVAGTRNLLAALHERGSDELDVVVLCSSTSALTGAVGQADYVAANAFLDATALAGDSPTSDAGARIVSIGWHTWLGAGMATEVDLPARLADVRRAQLAQGMRPDQACAALERLLSIGGPTHVVVSPVDIALHAGAPTPEPLPVALQATALGTDLVFPRPELSVPYAAATTDVEAEIITLWEAVLGVHPVGVDDDFLELGGDSLVAAGLVTAIEEAFGTRLSLRTIFEAPTVAHLSDAVVARLLTDPELDAPVDDDTDSYRVGTSDD